LAYQKFVATFPLLNKSLIDFPQFNELVHEYTFYFPATSATQVSRQTRLDFRPLSFVARKKTLDHNQKLLWAKTRDALPQLSSTARQHLPEFERQLRALQFNLYFYEQQSYSPSFLALLRNKYSDLETDFDFKEHIRLSLTLLKKRFLDEPIKDPAVYLKYLDINNKRAHRDFIFADIRRIYLGDQSHIEEINTNRLFDFRNSKKVKAEIEAHLKTALTGVQEPQEAVVGSLGQRDPPEDHQGTRLHHLSNVRTHPTAVHPGIRLRPN
jgi:hypothetical protein